MWIAFRDRSERIERLSGEASRRLGGTERVGTDRVEDEVREVSAVGCEVGEELQSAMKNERVGTEFERAS